MEVQLRFNANQIKQELKDQLDLRVKSLKSGNEEMYDELLNAFYDEIIEPGLISGGYDTGAFSEAKSGTSDRTHYHRYGVKTISPHHGIERDAVEERPGKDNHYFRGLFSKIFGVDMNEINGANIWEHLDDMYKFDYLLTVKDIVTKYMKEAE